MAERKAALGRVARLLMGARQPVIFTESAGGEPGVVDALVELAELLALPVVGACGGRQTVIPERMRSE